jgi:hypothetical protein
MRYISELAFEAHLMNRAVLIPPGSVLEDVRLNEGQPSSTIPDPNEVVFEYDGKQHTTSARTFFNVGMCRKVQ